MSESCTSRFWAFFIPLVLVLFVSDYAYAQAADAICPTDEFGSGYIARIVPCIKERIIYFGYLFIMKLAPVLIPAVMALSILYVVVFGYLILMGAVEKVSRDMFVMALKVAFVIGVTQSLPLIYSIFVGSSDQISATTIGLYNLVASAITGGFDGLVKGWASWMFGWNSYEKVGIIQGLVEVVSNNLMFPDSVCFNGGADALVSLNVWQRMDCIVNVVIGVSSPNSLADGMLSFAFHNIFTGSLGLLVGLMGLWIAYNVAKALRIALYYFLAVHVTITILILFGAVFIPMVYFANTKSFFDTWIKLLVSTTLQPMVIFMFVNLMITLMDVTLYSGKNSVYQTFAGSAAVENNVYQTSVDYGDGVRISQFSPNTFINANQLVTDKPMGPVFQVDSVEIEKDESVQPFDKEKNNKGVFGVFPTISAAELQKQITQHSRNFSLFSAKAIDYKKAEKQQTSNPDATGFELLGKVAGAMAKAAAAVYIFVMLLEVLPTLVSELAGGIKEVADMNNTYYGHSSYASSSNKTGIDVSSMIQRR